MKLSTKLKYQRIRKLLRNGREPKDIARYLEITTHVVYNVARLYNKRRLTQKKSKSREITKSAIRNGIIKRMPCSVCGNPKVDVHHENYSNPFKILWLCRKHHAQHHSHLRKQSISTLTPSAT